MSGSVGWGIEAGIRKAYFSPMQQRMFWHRWVAFVVAALFLFAAEPNTMAMPVVSAQPSQPVMAPCHMAMMSSPMAMVSKPVSPDGAGHHPSPCKNMAVCAGLLGCYGVNAIDTAAGLLFGAARADAPAVTVITAHGITHPPHNPPPIA